MTRAMHEIQGEALRLVTVKITGAIEVNDWLVVHRLTEQLREIAERGLYHLSQEKQREISAFALNNHQEKEPR